MGYAIELANAQTIRLHNHLSESLDHTEENFFTIPEEIETTKRILSILTKNHRDY